MKMEDCFTKPPGLYRRISNSADRTATADSFGTWKASGAFRTGCPKLSPPRRSQFDTLANLGFAATCNPLGAGKWRDDYSETLRWKNVVIFGDADETGQSHVDDVFRSVAGVARSLKRVKLPPGFHDVSDYAGSLPASTAAASIAKLIDETPEVSSLNSSNSYATMLRRAV